MLSYAILLMAGLAVGLAVCKAADFRAWHWWNGTQVCDGFGGKHSLSVAASATTAWFTPFAAAPLLSVLAHDPGANEWIKGTWAGIAACVLATLWYLQGREDMKSKTTRFDKETVVYSRRAFALLLPMTFCAVVYINANGLPGERLPARPFTVAGVLDFNFAGGKDGIQVLIEIPPASYGGSVPRSTAYEVDFLNGEEGNWYVANTSGAFAGRVRDLLPLLQSEEDKKSAYTDAQLQSHLSAARNAAKASQYFEEKLSNREFGFIENTSPPVLPVPVPGAKSVTVELPQNSRLTPIVLQLRLKPVDDRDVDLTEAKKRFKEGKGLIVHAIPLPK